ncbi:MAG: hypothetical protein PHN19_01910 [Patescibacteria group bacterium]|nr:hypothetical protein [Patescibacteria group bacterium]
MARILVEGKKIMIIAYSTIEKCVKEAIKRNVVITIQKIFLSDFFISCLLFS